MKTVLFFIISVMLAPMIVQADNGEEFTALLGIHLDKYTPLTDVKKKLGNGRLVETGSASERTAYICYYVPHCQLAIEFSSDDLGGPWHGVTAFKLTHSVHSPPDCSEMPRTDCSRFAISKKIRLGMSLDEYTGALGGNVKFYENKGIPGRPAPKGGFYIKSFLTQRPLSKYERRKFRKFHPEYEVPDLEDIGIDITATFEDNRLNEVQVYQQVTY